MSSDGDESAASVNDLSDHSFSDGSVEQHSPSRISLPHSHILRDIREGRQRVLPFSIRPAHVSVSLPHMCSQEEQASLLLPSCSGLSRSSDMQHSAVVVAERPSVCASMDNVAVESSVGALPLVSGASESSPPEEDCWSIDGGHSSSSSDGSDAANVEDAKSNPSAEAPPLSPLRADRCRSPLRGVSSGCVRSDPLPAQPKFIPHPQALPGTEFWVDRLWRALEPFWRDLVPGLSRKVNLHCLCAGTLAELHALKVWALRDCKQP